MLGTKVNNINVLTINNSLNITDENEWVDIKNTQKEDNGNELYKHICTKYNVHNKWVLLINPSTESFEDIFPTTIHQNNILRVHTNNGKINVDNISKALLKGNCSAIVLADIDLSKNELIRLKACASVGKTKCIILTKEETLH